MEILRIRGGHRLVGELEVPGSKNTALALMSAVVLGDGPSLLHKLPDLADTRVKARLLESFGAKVEWREGSCLIDCSNLCCGDAEPDMVRSIRTSFFLFGPLLARLGEVRLLSPGGCKIGARPIDLHLKGLAQLGADIDLVGGYYVGKVTKLRGADIYFDFPSAGATQHLMATATLAEGTTVLHHAASEPEVVALAGFLNRMGARIEGAGTSTITITGVSSLSGAPYTVPADRVQAGTYLIAGAMTGGDVTVRGILPQDQVALISKLRDAGVSIEQGHDWVRAVGVKRPSAIRLKTMPHPGFPTDLQQPMCAMLTIAEGTSIVEETIYENRIGHVQELSRMGARIRVEGRSMVVNGVRQLRGALVDASDLRAGAALCLAGLVAEGETKVRNIHFIDRGYERLEDRLRGLGADIERVAVDSLRDDGSSVEDPGLM
ncbi:MAG: UDP-N-acetylglucosamine 1-carboxyvinyltransferase [Fimbriimonadaceae bacterium]